MEATFRPLPVWPRRSTSSYDRRGTATFRAGMDDTLKLLQHELDLIGARHVVIGCALRPEDIRKDGWPRANARQPSHPGVEVSFTHPDQGRIAYATDVCESWQHNLRSIALGLQALRAVDRFGITERGQQHAGAKVLTAGGPSQEDVVTRGGRLVAEHGGVRAALHAVHPDHGGDPDDWHAMQAWREARGA